MSSAWGDSWGLAWGDSWGEIYVSGGGRVPTVKRKKKKKYTEEDIEGMAAFNSRGFGTKEDKEAAKEIIHESDEVISDAPLRDLGQISEDFILKTAIKENLDILGQHVELTPEMRKQLEMEQDIGLILAIIEAIDY